MTYWGEAYRLSLTGEVNDNWVDWIQTAVAVRDRPIVLDINSRGGFVDNAWNCFQLLQRHRALVTARVGAGAVCHSATVIVFAAARDRLAHVSSTFLIHTIAAVAPERWNAAAHRRFAASLENSDYAMFRALATRCGRPVAAIEAIAGEEPFSAITAQSIGLITDLEW
jgi:ATP-dependent protease ClpP protease subunit